MVQNGVQPDWNLLQNRLQELGINISHKQARGVFDIVKSG